MVGRLSLKYAIAYVFFVMALSASACSSGDNPRLTKPTQGLKDVACDTGNFFKNIFTVDTGKIATAILPLYGIARVIDEDIHQCFYSKKRNKNRHKIPSALCTFSDEWAIACTGTLNIGFVLFSHNERLRQTSLLFLIGLPFLALTTHSFKHVCHGDYCLRPLHDKFCKDHKRKRGGFPSTHAGSCFFVTTLFGRQFGPQAGIPLGILSSIVISCYIVDNRHYLSQLVAGAGLGIIFALAADKVVNKNMERHWKIQYDVMEDKSPALAVSWRF